MHSVSGADGDDIENGILSFKPGYEPDVWSSSSLNGRLPALVD